MASGASARVAFAFGPVGPGMAAAKAVGKFLFDMFCDTGSTLTDPMARAPDKDARGNPTGPIARMQTLPDDYDAAVVAKNKAIADRPAFVPDVPMPNPQVFDGIVCNLWHDTRTGDIGSAIDHAGFRAVQPDIWKEGAPGTMDQTLRKAASPDRPTADDAAKPGKTLDDGPINPPSLWRGLARARAGAWPGGRGLAAFTRRAGSRGHSAMPMA